MSRLHEDLAEEVLPHAPWEALAPHFERGAVVYVDGIDLVDAGVALATDDVASVERWLASGELRRPTQDDADGWAAREATFDMLVIEPWVLIANPTAPAAPD